MSDLRALATRTLPGTDLRVSALGLGCARIGGAFSPMGPAATIGFLREAYDSGIRLFDTADIYSQGDSERLLGAAFRDQRDSVVIVSKVGYRLSRRNSIAQLLKPLVGPAAQKLRMKRPRIMTHLAGPPAADQCFAPDYVVAAVEASLRRLGSDYLDVLLLHSPAPDVLRAGEFLEAAARLIERGIIRWFGVSCEHAEDVPLALQWGEVACVQVPFSVLHPEAARYFPDATARQKGVIGRQCFASGLLTKQSGLGALADLSDGQPDRLARCGAAAARLGLELGPASLRFSISAPAITSTLVGAHSSEQLQHCLEWARPGDLKRDEYELLLGATSRTL